MTDNKKREKIEVERTTYFMGKWDRRDIDEVISNLKEKKKDGWEKLELVSEYAPYDNDPTIKLVLIRMEHETDKEYHDRLKREDDQAARQLENERLAYERLKQKFGD